MGIGCVINIIMMTVVVLGIMTVASNPDMAKQSVPTLFMVQSGVGSRFLTPLISVLIILGAVSTAVNMVAAMVARICNKKPAKPAISPAAGSARITRKEIIAALICCLADFGIAQFGLLTLIQKAYSFLAYLAIPVMFGASGLKLVKFLVKGGGFSAEQFFVVLLAMVVSYGVSMIVIKFLMQYIKRHNFNSFALYRIALGIIVLIVGFAFGL